jgi:hypothetical protein
MRYTSARILAGIISLIGLIFSVIGAILAFNALQGSPQYAAANALQFAIAGSTLVSGLLLLAVGKGLEILADIARNTEPLRESVQATASISRFFDQMAARQKTAS